MFYNLNRWISTRSDALGALFSSGLGVYMVYGPGGATIGASNVGFSLAMAGMCARHSVVGTYLN